MSPDEAQPAPPSPPQALAFDDPLNLRTAGLFSGLDGLDTHLSPEQKSAFSLLDQTSANPRESRARALNRTFIRSQLKGVDGDLIDSNWEAVKSAYAKNALGVDKPALTDIELYGAIGKHMQEDAEARFGTIKPWTWRDTAGDQYFTAKRSVGHFFASISQPSVHLPPPPDDLPNIPKLGPLNPAIIGAVAKTIPIFGLPKGVYKGLTPLMEGMTSPFGIATLGAGAELKILSETYPAAKVALASMSGIFAGLMGHGAYQATKQAPEVFKDPNATFDDKVAAVVQPVAEGALALMGALGAAIESMPRAKVPPLLQQMQGKTPAEAAQIIRTEAAAPDAQPYSDFLNTAALELERISPPKEETSAVAPKETAPVPDSEPLPPAAQEIVGKAKALGMTAEVQEVGKEQPSPAAPVSPVENEVKPIKNLISIKNEVIDQELKEMGLPAAEHGESLSFKAALEDATAKLAEDDQAGAKLVESLAAKARPVTGQEDALLLTELNRRKLARDAAEREFIELSETSDPGGMMVAKMRVAKARDAFEQAADVVTKVGTKNAQGLALRRMMMKEDYSLAAMERRRRLANDGKPLTDEQQAEVRALHQKVLETQKTFDDYRARQEKEARTAPRARPPQRRISAYLAEQAEAARGRIRERLQSGRTSAGIDPADVADYAIIGADYLARGVAKFADWSTAMVKEFGETIRPHLQDIFSRAEIEHASADLRGLLDKRKAALERSIEKLKEKVESGDISTTPVKANRPASEEFETLEQERDSLRDSLSSMRKQAAKVKELEAAIAEKEDKIKKGDLSAKGRPANRPSDEEVEKLKLERDALNVALAKARVDKARGDETAILDKRKAALESKIAKRKEQLKTGAIDPEPRAANRPMVAELERAKQELEKINAEIAEARKEPPKTKEHLRGEYLDREIAELERQLRLGEVFRPSRPAGAVQSADIAVKEQRLEALKEEREYARQQLQPSPEPKSADEISLQAYKARTESRIKELKEKLDTGDLSKEERRPIPLDKEALRLKAEHERVKRLVQLAEMRDTLQNRNGTEKALGAFVQWARFGALSWPTVFAKLTGAAVIRTVTTPLEQAVGYGVSKLLPELAARAPREGVPEIGLAMRAEAKALTESMTTGMKGAADLLRGHETDEAALLEKAQLPPGVVEYLGKIHSALKYPTKINEYARSLEVRTAHALRNGIDPTDPIQQMRLMHEAWMDANRSIFMQDNAVVTAYRSGVAALTRKGRDAGKPSKAMEFLAAGIESQFPVVKVPTNVIAEASQILTGWLTGPAKAAFAYAKGIETLNGAEADAIMRLIKKGSIGLALTALGFFKAKQIGGFFQRGEKRSPDDVKPGDFKVSDVTVPSQLTHNPYATVMQFGATMRRVADSRFKKSDAQSRGIASGLLAASLGLIEETPFMRETLTMGELTNPRTAGEVVDQKLANTLIPGTVQWIAAQLDKQHPFNFTEAPARRKPTNLTQALEKGVPGLRERVPASDRDPWTSYRK